mgnify:CR=1 FL=1
MAALAAGLVFGLWYPGAYRLMSGGRELFLLVTSVDVVLGISNSGESDELVAILPVLKRQGVPLVAITANLQSTLARHAEGQQHTLGAYNRPWR